MQLQAVYLTLKCEMLPMHQSPVANARILPSALRTTFAIAAGTCLMLSLAKENQLTGKNGNSMWIV